MKKLLTFGLLFLVCFAYGQSFKRYYGPNIYKVVPDSNGEFVGISHTEIFMGLTTPDPIYGYFCRFSPKGELLSTVSLGSVWGGDYGLVTSDGEYIFTDGYNGLEKYDKKGTVVWEKTLGSGIEDLKKDPKDYLLIVTKEYNTTFFYKIDSQTGDTIWHKSIPDIQNIKILPLVDGYIVSGNINDSSYFVQYSLNGDSLSSKVYTQLNPPISELIQNDSFIYATTTSGHLVKLDTNLDTLWNRNTGVGLTFASASDSLIGFGGDGSYLGKMDFEGNIIWKTSFEGSMKTWSMTPFPDGSLVAVCTTAVNGNHTLIVRVDKNGNLLPDRATGTVLLDTNKTCQPEPGAPAVSGILMKVIPGPLYAVTDSAGNYSLPADTGMEYIVTPARLDTTIYSNCTKADTFLISSGQTAKTLDTFLLEKVYCPKLLIGADFFTVEDCFRDYKTLVVKNAGNLEAENVSLSLEFPSYLHILKTSLPYIQQGDSLLFSLGNIPPGKNAKIYFTDSVDCQYLSFGFHGYNVRISAATTTQCVYPSLSKTSRTLGIYITSSYDPNSITVFPSVININDYKAGTKTVDYLIHFQNTGNGPAANVKISDTLPPQLDVSSLRNIFSDHKVSYDILNTSEGQILEFYFENINLPYQSQSDSASQGFVSFTIDLKDSLSAGTVIPDAAAIFFDYNAAVLTNQALVELSATEPTEQYEKQTLTVVTPQTSTRTIALFPNPVDQNQAIRFTGTASNCTVIISDLTGKEIRRVQFESLQSDILKADLETGMYFYQVRNETGLLGNGKFIVR